MIRNWISRFMSGRYGRDQLSTVLLVVYFILYVVGSLLGSTLFGTVIYWVSVVLACYGIFRMLSRNYSARRRENVRFLKLAGPALQWYKMKVTIHRDKVHRYFKCPNCHQYLRVPKGKGKISITCRSCGVSFEEKS